MSLGTGPLTSPQVPFQTALGAPLRSNVARFNGSLGLTAPGTGVRIGGAPPMRRAAGSASLAPQAPLPAVFTPTQLLQQQAALALQQQRLQAMLTAASASFAGVAPTQLGSQLQRPALSNAVTCLKMAGSKKRQRKKDNLDEERPSDHEIVSEDDDTKPKAAR
jgi:hypothetical protein